jgi:hypothetical protein
MSSERSSWGIKVAKEMSSGRGDASERTKKGWILSVMSGVLKANIFDRITLVDNSDTTEYGFSIGFGGRYEVC